MHIEREDGTYDITDILVHRNGAYTMSVSASVNGLRVFVDNVEPTILGMGRGVASEVVTGLIAAYNNAPLTVLEEAALADPDIMGEAND